MPVVVYNEHTNMSFLQVTIIYYNNKNVLGILYRSEMTVNKGTHVSFRDLV